MIAVGELRYVYTIFDAKVIKTKKLSFFLKLASCFVKLIHYSINDIYSDNR